MRFPHTRPTGRAGFTLIELLVVIAIIAVLVGLTTAAVMKLRGEGPKAVDRTDLNNLYAALQKFKAEKGFYPPSRFFLANSWSQYNSANALHVKSLEYLNTMFPRLGQFSGLDWSGGINKAAVDRGVTLEGDQCYVFFLGGIPASDGASPPSFGCQGFSTYSRNPTQSPTATDKERIRYYEFKGGRLLQRVAANPFLSYLNGHENKPYAYFSSYKSENGYNAFGLPGAPGAVSDCTSLGVWPYAETWTTPVRYLNPATCQLISAGADGKFGPGTTNAATVWTPTTAANIGADGQDDISNFHPNILGAP